VFSTTTGLQQMSDFAFFGKTLQTFLGKNQLAISNNLEHTSRRGYQLYFRTKRIFQFSPQTGGTRLVVSFCAVLYGYLHLFFLQCFLIYHNAASIIANITVSEYHCHCVEL